MIRNAKKTDIPALFTLLQQVLTVHADKRPDVFKAGSTKYTVKELEELLNNPRTPVFVFVDEKDCVQGYAFCQYVSIENNNILQSTSYLYLDDLCVDENHRKQGIGKALLSHVIEQAKQNGCSSLRLNVWSLNESAMRFYEQSGFAPLSLKMEKKL